MPTKLNPDGSPNTSRDPGDKDWQQKTARYDSRQQKPAGDSRDPRSEYNPQTSPKGDASDPRGDLVEREQTAASSAPQDDLATRESAGEARWKTKVSGKSDEKKGAKGLFTKKRSLWALIALVTASAAFVMTTLITPAITLVNFKEVLTRKFSKVENSIIDRRTNRILAKKLSKDITTGCTIKIKCRYKGMKTSEIKKFNRRNVGEGWRIESKGRSKLPPFKNKVELQKISGSGDNIKVERVVDASEVKRVLREDPSLQKSFRNFNKGVVTFWADAKARSLWKKFGIKLNKREPKEGEGKNDRKRRASRINQEISDVTTAGEGHDKQGGHLGDAEEYVDDRADQLSEEASDPTKDVPPEPDVSNYKEMDRIYGNTAESLEHASPGFLTGIANPVAASIFNYCLVQELSNKVFDLRKTLMTVQLMRYAINFARLADQIKAGEADANTTQEIGDMTTVLTQKDQFGKTAFDSFGYNWAAYGKVGKRGANQDITKYQTGGGPPGKLGSVVGAVNSIIPEKLCDIANSGWAAVVLGGIQLGAILFSGGTFAIVKEGAQLAAEQGIKMGIQFTVKELSQTILERILTKRFAATILGAGATVAFFHYAVPPLIGLAARIITGTVITGSDRGLDAGNAAVSGFGAAGAASGRAHGMAFLNKDNAMQGDRVATAYTQKMAKVDGVNPLDPTNPRSFAGKLATAILPSMAQLSFANAPTTLANFSLSSLAGLGKTPSLQAANDSAQYDICKDEAYGQLDIAVDPFCNPVTGMDPNTIDSPATDPNKVIDYMLAHGYINKNGDAKDDYKKFLRKCVDSTEPITSDDDICKDPSSMSGADETKYTMFHYFTIDGNINDDMEDVDASSAPSAPINGDAQELAQQLLSNPKVTYPYHDSARGLTVKDVLKHVVNTGKGIVDSSDVSFTSVPISTKLLGALVEYAQDHEIALNCLSNCDHTSSSSNHYKGLAVDIGCSPGLDVTAFNEIASKYGGKNNGEVCPGDSHYHYDFPPSD